MDNFNLKQFLKENKELNTNNLSRLDTSSYIGPEEMEATLSQIYHIIANNERDFGSHIYTTKVIQALKDYA